MENLTKEIYPLIFAVVPDEFHTSMAIEDAFVVSTVTDRNLYNQLQTNGPIPSLLDELHANFFKYAFNMAKSRAKQLEMDPNWRDSRPLKNQEKYFYRLTIEERGILFVWTNLKNRIDLFSKILGFSKDSYFEKVLEIRRKVIKYSTE